MLMFGDGGAPFPIVTFPPMHTTCRFVPATLVITFTAVPFI
jgi:hypothetical protein